MSEFRRAIDGVRSHFQPVVDLDHGAVVGFEALARGPEGPWRTPVALFSEARRLGRLAELDETCRTAALSGARRCGFLSPFTVFVNVEPEALGAVALDGFLSEHGWLTEGLTVVVEITERSLAQRPADLLAAVDRFRSRGWRIALDDVGAEPASLTLMSLLRPDVVKLDLSLVQQNASPRIATLMNAVNAYADRSGALVLAEGIETPEHVEVARSLGATLGQGWFFGQPDARPTAPVPALPLRFPARAGRRGSLTRVSPFDQLPPGTRLRVARKRLLVELSKHLEQEALRVGETCIVASTLQHEVHYTPATATRYAELAQRVGFVCLLGEGLRRDLVPGLRSETLAPGDPLLGEWDVVVLSPHFAVALLARDLGDSGPDEERRFEFALTYDRDTVVAAAGGLMARLTQETASPRPRYRGAIRSAPSMRITSPLR